MEALGASHLKLFVSRQRDKEIVAFIRQEFGYQKRVGDGLVFFRPNCVASVSSPSSSSSQTKLGSEAIQPLNLDQPKTVRVRFKLHKQCAFGQQFLVVGDDPCLGLWDPSDGVPLNWSEGHVWTAEVDIPCSKVVSYKFILEEIGGTVLWQPGPDRVLETWDTAKTISVSEDWDSPDFQNVVEEEPVVVDGVNESSLDDPGFLIGEHWDQTDDSSEEEVCAGTSSLDKGVVEAEKDVMKEEVCADISNLGKGVVEEGNDVMKEEGNDVMIEETDGDERTSDHSDEPSLLMVAENITVEQDSSVSVEGLGLVSLGGEEQEETTLVDHGGSDDSSRLEDETRLVVDEGVPVLVLGLATLPPEEVEEAEAEADAELEAEASSTGTRDVCGEILEVTTTACDEIEDSIDQNQKKNNVVEDIATECDEIEDSADLNPRNSNVVEDATAKSDANEAATEPEILVSAVLPHADAGEMTVVEEKPRLNGDKKQILDKKKNNIVQVIATESDEIEDSADLNPRNNNVEDDAMAESAANEAVTEPEIHVSAALHHAEASEVTVGEEEKLRPNGVKKQILDNDMKWGRRALHKFLANLGFMQHR